MRKHGKTSTPTDPEGRLRGSSRPSAPRRPRAGHTASAGASSQGLQHARGLVTTLTLQCGSRVTNRRSKELQHKPGLCGPASLQAQVRSPPRGRQTASQALCPQARHKPKAQDTALRARLPGPLPAGRHRVRAHAWFPGRSDASATPAFCSPPTHASLCADSHNHTSRLARAFVPLGGNPQ